MSFRSEKGKRALSMVCIILSVTVLMVSLTACKSKSKSKKGAYEYYLYYIDKDITKLEPTMYYTDTENISILIDELISQMKETSSKINSITAMPSDVIIHDWFLEDRVLYLNFTESYNEMGKVREILCRASVVLTFCQLDGIDYVNFSIDTQELLDGTGKTVGNMKASDFIDSSGATINSYEKKSLVLYVADESGEKLKEKTVEAVYSVNTSMEHFIIDQLQKIKSKDGIKRTVPSNVKINNITTKDGICYIDFDETFLTEKAEVSDEVKICSIVNSLCELPYVNKVHFSVNGDSNKKLSDKIQLDNFFVRNLDLVE